MGYWAEKESIWEGCWKKEVWEINKHSEFYNQWSKESILNPREWLQSTLFHKLSSTSRSKPEGSSPEHQNFGIVKKDWWLKPLKIDDQRYFIESWRSGNILQKPSNSTSRVELKFKEKYALPWRKKLKISRRGKSLEE